MSDEKRAPWKYLVMADGERFAVICVHEQSSDWWHVIARFANKDRADRYAEVEQMMADDNVLEAHTGWDGDEAPAPVANLPPAPPSGISVERIRAPSPAERARVGTALVSEAAAEVGARATVQIEKHTDWDEVDQAIRAFWPTEMSVAEMARRCKVSGPTIYKHARDMGLPARGGNHVAEEIGTQIIEGLAAGKSVREVVAETGAAKGTVESRRKALVDEGVVQPRASLVDPVRGDAIMRVAMAKPPQPLKAIVGQKPLSKEADDLWLFVSDLDGETKQSEWSAESGIPVPVIKAATEQLIQAGIMIRAATGHLTVGELHPKSEAAKVEDEEPALIEPPTGCPLNAAECASFKTRWDAGDSMRELADQFNLTTIEVADVRKKLGLPNRVNA